MQNLRKRALRAWDMLTVMSLAAACLAILLVLTVRGVAGQKPQVGDMVEIKAPADVRAGSVRVVAQVPGGTCDIGTGNLMEAGGSLFVVEVEPDGMLVADWSGSGRSITIGHDCGTRRQVRLWSGDFWSLSAAQAGWGADNGHPGDS